MILRNALSLILLAVAGMSGPVVAQTVQENSDADALAADMRLLAANPLDVEALITAGEITLRMGDTTASATFFGRAERIDPLNPRVKAGMASLMLRAERPGEALRRFRDAETRGLDPRKFAADRGLAYDLIGEQERAQRDYRLALQAGPDDEVTRRYALSMAISGRTAEAMKLLDPLLRRGDRAAWRDRAFVLAMGGDQAGARKIADTMMTPGLGAGLMPFFQRLPQLSPIDRAFAVTFGDVRATPERLADARLAPPMAKLGPDPTAPKPVAVAEQVVQVGRDGRQHKRKDRGRDRDRALAAVATPVPAEISALPPPPAARTTPVAPSVAVVQPLPAARDGARSIPSTAMVQPLPGTRGRTEVATATPPPALPSTPPPAPAPAPSSGTPTPPVEVAANVARRRPPLVYAPGRLTPTLPPGSSRAPVAVVTPQPVPSAPAGASPASTPPKDRVAAEAAPVEIAASQPPAPAGASPAEPSPAAPVVRSDTPAAAPIVSYPTPPAVTPPVSTGASAPSQPPQPVEGTTAPIVVPPPQAVASAPVSSEPKPGVADQPSPAEAGVPPRTSVAHSSEDSVLARIIAGIDVPGSELGVAPMPQRPARPAAAPPAPAPEPAGEATARAAPPRADTARTSSSGKRAAATDEAETASRAGKKGAVETDGTDMASGPGRAKDTRKAGKASRDDASGKDASVAGGSKGRKGEDTTAAAETCPPVDDTKTGRKGRAAARPVAAATRSQRGKAIRCPAPDARDAADDRNGKDQSARDRTRRDAASRDAAADKDSKGTRGDTARIWVQVAGGANEDTLNKAWAAQKAKAPELFRGRQGWSTPLRATNRVLTGPFKTAEEAQDYVNRLAKAGVSGFVFTSAKGQKVERLSAQ